MKSISLVLTLLFSSTLAAPLESTYSALSAREEAGLFDDLIGGTLGGQSEQPSRLTQRDEAPLGALLGNPGGLTGGLTGGSSAGLGGLTGGLTGLTGGLTGRSAGLGGLQALTGAPRAPINTRALISTSERKLSSMASSAPLGGLTGGIGGVSKGPGGLTGGAAVKKREEAVLGDLLGGLPLGNLLGGLGLKKRDGQGLSEREEAILGGLLGSLGGLTGGLTGGLAKRDTEGGVLGTVSKLVDNISVDIPELKAPGKKLSEAIADIEKVAQEKASEGSDAAKDAEDAVSKDTPTLA
ncbi:hypothetical protein ACJ41O_002832 [Fusarium nematophilum]